jgi:hypothetical protein
MRKAFWQTELIIDTERYYPPLELFELMRENLEDKFGSIIIKKVLTLETISVQGVDGYINKVTSMKWLSAKKGRIVVRQEKPLDPIKITGRGVVMGFVTGIAGYILWLLLCIVTVGLLIWSITQGILWLTAGIIAIVLVFIAYTIISGPLACILNLEGTKANRAMMKTLGEEIEKLVKGGTQH